MIELKKHIYDKNNGLWYERSGDYYIPMLALPEDGRPIGRWGRMHRDYLKGIIRFSLTTWSLADGSGHIWLI